MDKMKTALLAVIFFSLELVAFARTIPCDNLWDPNCVDGKTMDSINEIYFNGETDRIRNELLEERIKNLLWGNFRPGGRCMNIWDEGCINGQLPGTGKDDNFLNGGSSPGKRCPGGHCGTGSLKALPLTDDNTLSKYFEALKYKNLNLHKK